MSKASRRIAAILAADVAGYSRLMGADEASTLAALRELREVLFEPVVMAHHGEVVKRMGDGWLVEFASVADAVDGALEIQAGLDGHERIKLRIGIHIGDITHEAEDIFGDGVNIAARLQELADPGGIALSAMAHGFLDAKHATRFRDGGNRALKNIAEPVQVFFAGGADLAGDAARLPLPDKPSIAVLPFDNMSDDAKQDYFADGLAEDIITTLSKISNLFVIARNSSFAYKGRAVDIRQVAGELGVRYVLEGSVRAAGERLRITAQLIDAVDGGHLWADRYDRRVDDVFDIQDEIMREIVNALRLRLSDGEQAQIWLRGTDSVEAWSYAMQGVDLAMQGSAQATAEGRRLLQRAVAVDPGYAMAHGWIAQTHYFDGHFGFTDDSRASLEAADAAADLTLSLDANSPVALSMKGSLDLALRDDPSGVEGNRRAVRLSPSDTFVKMTLARSLTNLGELEEAERELKQAMRLNPFCPVYYYGIFANVLEMQGRDDAAMALLRRALEQNRDYFSGHLRLASLLGLAGRIEEASGHAAEARRLNPRFSRASLATYYPTNDEAALTRFLTGLKAAGLDLTE